MIGAASRLTRVEALSYGPEVIALQGAAGEVIAVLRNAVYLRSFAGYVVGVTDQGAPNGPLTLRVADFPTLYRALEGQQAMTFRATGECIEIGGSVGISMGNARRWKPQLPSEIGSSNKRAEACSALAGVLNRGGGGIAQLAALLTDTNLFIADGGLMPMQSDACSDPLSDKVTRQLEAFHKAVTGQSGAEAAQALVKLLGLGPGLTPTGDDLVVGIIASLAWQACLGRVLEPAATTIIAAVREAAPRRTNVISARLLWHAGEGVLYAPAMKLGAALLRGEAAHIPEPAQHLLAIGSSTGADLACGLMFGTLLGLEEPIDGRSHKS